MEVPLAVIADYANVAEPGKLNIMGIFDRIWSSKFPYAHPMLFLVLRATAEPAEYSSRKSIEVKLLAADGEEVTSLSGHVDVGHRNDGRLIEVRHILRFTNLRFEQPGDYAFSVLVNGEPKARVPLRVEELKEGGDEDGT